jgi:hypothetical protein
LFKFHSNEKESILFDYIYYPIEEIDSPDYDCFDILFQVAFHKDLETEDFKFISSKGTNEYDFLHTKIQDLSLVDFAVGINGLRKAVLEMFYSLKEGNSNKCLEEEKHSFVVSRGEEEDLFKIVFKFHYNADDSIYGGVEIYSLLEEKLLEERGVKIDYFFFDGMKFFKITKGDFEGSFQIEGKFKTESNMNRWVFQILEIFRIVSFVE